MQQLANTILIFSLAITVIFSFRAILQYKRGDVSEKKKLVKTSLISLVIMFIAMGLVTMFIISSS
ncbi:hypothetical protein JNUCC42_13290 [Brevibacterium sp. JNUCC-42]|uniref:Uncharacterized protein n=1 Tax=Brevibacillus laterosporus TaxID=1465 RepID=A0A518VES5_BRELA|nr:hypothetical protein [Brevibacillus laterosporus]QDX95482.1 hypothetical protein EEL30_26385 [Brevibacillus laterosporus]QOS97564.1 hypothetical protein JNUCC42_13290 [Brevibacterium sp. JNUCC-42]RAP24642.1 hypothetical protein C2W64_02810 [Brevibacillus laterosporus]TPG69396.1 hypothetical protein EEL31_13340 [Brevibacillus laterosporus]